jgi:hypothetical protein
VTAGMGVTVSRIEGDVMKVNAFLLQWPRGVALVGGMLTMSDARKVSEALDATGTELAWVAITHPQPDHYAGLAQIPGTATCPSSPPARWMP